jgi:phosphoribosyl-ATP pyrophosphohydrolase
MPEDVLQRLFAVIEARRTEAAGPSYTRELLDAGPERCARKLGEEAVETLIAALGTDRTALVREAADLTYHLLVVLASRGVTLAEVLAELSSRMGTSGLREKASRGKGAA